MFANCFFKKIISPVWDVMDFLNIQDGGWLLSLSFYSFNISKTKHVIENLATDIIVTSMVLIDKAK